MIRRVLSIAVLAGILGLSGATVARACPSCKEAMASQGPAEAARLRSGYFYSILLMIGTPLTLASVGIYCVRRAVKSGAIPEL